MPVVVLGGLQSFRWEFFVYCLGTSVGRPTDFQPLNPSRKMAIFSLGMPISASRVAANSLSSHAPPSQYRMIFSAVKHGPRILSI